MNDSTFTKTAFFAAPRETVWSFLTDKDKLGQWFYRAQANLSTGQSYVLMGKDKDGTESKRCWGEVIEFQPPGLLRYTFTIAPLNGVMTTVTWTLEEAVGGTRLTLQHEGLEQAGDSALGLIMALDSGWDKHIAGLRAALAS